MEQNYYQEYLTVKESHSCFALMPAQITNEPTFCTDFESKYGSLGKSGP